LFDSDLIAVFGSRQKQLVKVMLLVKMPPG